MGLQVRESMSSNHALGSDTAYCYERKTLSVGRLVTDELDQSLKQLTNSEHCQAAVQQFTVHHLLLLGGIGGLKLGPAKV
jgi:hypothetical protein